MENRCYIISSISARIFQLCLIYVHNKRMKYMTSPTWLPNWVQFTDQPQIEDACCISDSASARTLELCQMCMHNKLMICIMSSIWSCDLGTINRPATK